MMILFRRVMWIGKFRKLQSLDRLRTQINTASPETATRSIQTKPKTQNLVQADKFTKRLNAQKQLSSQIMQCFKADEIFKICKGKELNLIHKSVIFCRLVEVCSNSQEELFTPHFKGIVQSLSQNLEELNPESMIHLLRASIQLSDKKQFLNLCNRILEIFKEPGSTALISYQLALQLACILTKMKQAEIGNPQQLRRLTKRCLQRVIPNLRKVSTMHLVKLFPVQKTFKFGAINLVKPILVQALKRKEYIKPGHLIDMLQITLNGDFEHSLKLEDNLAHKIINQLSKNIRSISLDHLYKTLEMAAASKGHLSQKDYEYLLEMLIDNSLKKYQERILTATIDRPAKLPYLVDFLRFTSENKSPFITERTKRFAETCLSHISHLDTQGKLTIFWYMVTEQKTTKVDWGEVFTNSRAAVDSKQAKLIFELLPYDQFKQLFRKQGAFHKIVLFCFKELFNNIHKYSNQQISDKIIKISRELPEHLDSIQKRALKSLKFTVNLPEWIIDVLVKYKQLFQKREKPLRPQKTKEPSQQEIEQYEKYKVIRIVGNKITAMIKIMLSCLIMHAEVGGQKIKIVDQIQHFLSFGLSQIGFDCLLTDEDLQNLRVISFYTKKTPIQNSKRYSQYLSERPEKLKKQIEDNKEILNEIVHKQNILNFKIGESINQIYTDLYLPESKQIYVFEPFSFLEQALLKKAGTFTIHRVKVPEKQTHVPSKEKEEVQQQEQVSTV